jgi:hypothetical protein
MSGHDALAGIGQDELRAAVRAVLRDVLPAGVTDAPPTPTAGPRAGQGDVTIESAADLTALVRRVAALCEDPQVRAALQAGQHGFQLVTTAHTTARSADAAAEVMTIERGAVTERAVVRAAEAGGRLRLGPRAVLTPLARDKARTLGVQIEKER